MIAAVSAAIASGTLLSGSVVSAAPTGDCDWVDPAAVAELPVHEAAGELSELTTFSAAVSATDLAAELPDDGAFTIFAPSNDAFAEIPENVWDSIIADPDLLSSILGYHVVVGEALAPDDLVAAGTVETLVGPLEISTDGDTLVVNGGEATVTCAGVVTANATVYVIDRVLQPATSDLTSGGSSVPGSSTPGSSVPGSSVPG
jgi:uncharacterized surface protein with fasciclin (FAS1) repeats